MEINHEAILGQMPDAIIIADRSGNISYWNPAAEKVFGIPVAEALGANLDVIIPGALREAHWRGFERALESGVTKYNGQALPTKAIHKSGNEIYVEMSFGLVMHDGVPVGALACARDITDKFQKDREARRHLREVEAEVTRLRDELAKAPAQ